MKIFGRKKETAVAVIQDNPIVVSVPDIKEYLVKEYERTHDLELEIEQLKTDLELAREIKLEYDALLVTLDEYSKRLERVDALNRNKDGLIKQERQENDRIRDELNSYKIRFNEIALTKEQIEKEIAEKTATEIKTEIIERISELKGNISKKTICEIIGGVTLTEKGDVE